jgi:hypothetical protein
MRNRKPGVHFGRSYSLFANSLLRALQINERLVRSAQPTRDKSRNAPIATASFLEVDASPTVELVTQLSTHDPS